MGADSEVADEWEMSPVLGMVGRRGIGVNYDQGVGVSACNCDDWLLLQHESAWTSCHSLIHMRFLGGIAVGSARMRPKE